MVNAEGGQAKYFSRKGSLQPSAEWLNEHEAERVTRWGNATDVERGRALAELLELADGIMRGRRQMGVPDPVKDIFPGFPGSRLQQRQLKEKKEGTTPVK